MKVKLLDNVKSIYGEFHKGDIIDAPDYYASHLIYSGVGMIADPQAEPTNAGNFLLKAGLWTGFLRR